MGTPKSSAEATENSAETAQNLCGKVECTIVREIFASTARNPIRLEARQYIREATIQNKLRLGKCDVYTVKEILGYREKKSYISVARGEQRERNIYEGQEEKQIHK